MQQTTTANEDGGVVVSTPRSDHSQRRWLLVSPSLSFRTIPSSSSSSLFPGLFFFCKLLVCLLVCGFVCLWCLCVCVCVCCRLQAGELRKQNRTEQNKKPEVRLWLCSFRSFFVFSFQPSMFLFCCNVLYFVVCPW